jgi:hypothetical protein
VTANPAALLARARELVRTQLATSLATALDGLPGELQTLAAATTSPEEARLLDNATREVRANRDAIAAGFERNLLTIFDRKVRPAGKTPAGAEPTLGELTLVDDAVIELEIARSRLVRKTAEELDADQLAGVGARLGALVGARPLEGDANPLGPETALEALQTACSAVPTDGAVRMTLVNGLQPHVAAALRRLYPDLNEMLIAAGVLPKIRHEIQRARNSPAGPRGGGASPGTASSGSGAPGGLPAGMTVSQAMALKDLLPGATGSPIDLGAIVAALLEGPASSRQYGARMLANSEGSLFERAMATPVHPDVLAQLSQLQGTGVADATHGTAELLGAVQQVGRAQHHPLDQLTGELVAVVFDFLLNDRDIADAVRAQLARLQVVAFKAALLDRSFFARREHPLRELLAAIADAAADPAVDTAPESRFVAGLRALVDEVLARFTDDLAVFVAAREQLATLVGELAADSEREVETLAAPLAEQERTEALRARARTDVARRIADAPDFVREFLTETWARVVADSGADRRDASLAVVDDLVWSVAPKQPTDLPRFTALLPKLVPALGRGMQAVGVAGEARQGFLDELMRTHTALLQAARAKRPAAPPAATPSPAPPVVETEVVPTPELAADAMLGLERGAIVEFFDAEGPVRAKLSWISPGRTLYLFTAHGAKARQLSPGDLRTALREERARLVEEGRAVLDRALAVVAGG